MKKRVLSVLLCAVLAMSTLVACGSDEDAAPAAKEEAVEETEEAAEEEAEEVEVAEETEEAAEEVADSEGFSLLDVSTDMIQAGYYTIDDENTEQVVALFEGPDGAYYVSLMLIPAEGQGDVICGSYTGDNVEQTLDEENGVTWTSISFTDVYTGSDCTVVFGDGDDGSCGIANADFSNFTEGQYLTADETINYMGAAVQYIQ